ncbi:DUF2938 family protein [Bartonella tamiae]|uniref:DUF2938 family protein n=1 Tax=Bartonella tamiae TaxID=373638 RepID=UPI003CC918F9
MGSVIFLFFIMQPAFSIGIAVSKTPNPWISRFKSLVAHSSFGLGLYISLHIVNYFNV